MTNRMWGGRYAAGPAAIMEEINASIDFDKTLWRQDIDGSKAHATMLAKQGIIAAKDAKLLYIPVVSTVPPLSPRRSLSLPHVFPSRR